AGPWDYIGHAEVPESKVDGKVARHLDRDDMVANAINTFVGLTVQCAQCHNHKFDPVRQEDYYALQAVFAALDRADRPYYDRREGGKEAEELAARDRKLQGFRQASESAVAAAAGAALAKVKIAVPQVKPAGLVYAGTVHHGSGTFLGTGPDGGKPRTIRLLR